MDWNAAVEKNRDALKRILAMLVAMTEVGLREGGGGSDLAQAEKSKLSLALTPALTLPRQLHRVILRLLRPAEAAVRRLIIVAARGLVLPLPRPRQPEIARKPGRAGTPQNLALPPLPLLDRLSPWSVRARPVSRGGVPRISVPGYSQPFLIRPPSPDDPIDATRLGQRLQALAIALDDLPAQAKRFARWRARAMPPKSRPPHCEEGLGLRVRGARSRDVLPAIARSRRIWPLRPGQPPGWRRKPSHEVHEVLDVVHGLAFWVLASPDTS